MATSKVSGDLELKLKGLGANWYDLMLPETKSLEHILRPDEEILGIVYGRYFVEGKNLTSRGLMVATDKRVFVLNTKPFFKQNDEISYFVISGVNYTRVVFSGTVTLHTRTGDVNMRTFNDACAQNFVKAIESKIITAIQ